MKKHLEVAAAILVRGGKILCAKRGAYKYNYVANKFEFPGGKLEAGEITYNELRTFKIK